MTTDATHIKKATGAKVFWDICDPVHWFSPKEARAMADAVDGIVCSNENLESDFREWYGGSGKTILTIPDRINLDHFPIKRTHQRAETIRFIWYGAGQNRFSLLGAFANLERLVANGVSLSLTIFDDRPHDNWQGVVSFPIYHAKWELDTENAIIAEHDIALLPPYPGAWGKVKSNNKRLTANACGLNVWLGETYQVGWNYCNFVEARRACSISRDYTIEKSISQWKELLCLE